MELSSVEPATVSGAAATIHRVRAEGVVPITAGTPALFGSVYDLTAHRRSDVTVSAQRLL